MKIENTTMTTEFFIVGFSDFPHLRLPLFIIFLMIYQITLCGNLFIVLIICYTPRLHTPMYFFLVNLSFVDVTSTTAIFPAMLANFFDERQYVTLKICLIQLYFYVAMIGAEFLILTVMAYDRYVAICNPLRYTVIMNRTVCCRLASVAVIFSLMAPIPHIVATSQLAFCDSHEINHFFCDITALMKISCSSTRSIENLTYVIGAVVGMFSFLLILTSYVRIISSILKIPSADGRWKGFSTCASHLTVVLLLYASLIIMYLRPPSMYSMTQNKFFSLLHCAAVPLCNPIIYSLKNKELQGAMRKAKSMLKA